MAGQPSSLADIPVLILCGGLGTRLRSVVADRPKALAPIGDAPFLQLQMELLRDQGARHFVLCVGHMAEQVESQFGTGQELGVRIDYSREGDKLLGTGGAMKLAEQYFAPSALVVNGDTYFDIDHNEVVWHHSRMKQEFGVVATLSLARLDDARRFGTVELDESGRFVKSFREKNPDAGSAPGWLNAGAYVIERTLIDRIPSEAVVSVERVVFPAALGDGLRLSGFCCHRPFYDIGTPEDFQAFVERFEEMRNARKGSDADRNSAACRTSGPAQ